MPKPFVIVVAATIVGLIVFAWHAAPGDADALVAKDTQTGSPVPLQRIVQTPVYRDEDAPRTSVDETPAPPEQIPGTLATIRVLGAGAEQALITSESGLRFEMTQTLMDDVHFDELISALDSDLVGLELQSDLLPLIYEWAGANAIAVDRVACGEKVCAMRLYGQSKAALDAYMKSLTDASDGRVLSRNWEDRATSPDWIERRLIFATDQSVNGFLFENSGG